MIPGKDIYCKTQTNKYVKRSTRGYSFLEATELITSFTSRAGQAGGGSFQEKKYKSKKKFAYRMCTG